MREKLEYYLLKLFLFFVRVMPKSFIYFNVKILALLAFYAIKKRRQLTIKNLSLAFPQSSEKEIYMLAKQTYTELSKTISEILFMFVDKMDIDQAISNIDEAREKIQQLSKSAKDGIIVITAHFSNWELAAHFLGKNGLPLLSIGREGNNLLIDKHITIPFRNKHGNTATSKDNAMMAMVRVLKKGGAVGLLIDQKSGHLNSVNVPFFNQLAETVLSVATLKEKFNPLIVPIFAVRNKDNTYQLIIQDPVEMTFDESTEKDEKLKQMTAKYNIIIEDIVRKHPEQWFWMHNRWRL